MSIYRNNCNPQKTDRNIFDNPAPHLENIYAYNKAHKDNYLINK